MSALCRLVVLLGLVVMIQARAEELPLDSRDWKIVAEEGLITTHLGRKSLKLKGGMAWLSDFDFSDGTIMFEMAFANERGFSGIAWRMQDDSNFEHFYLRPHRTGQPDANQYTPVFNGVAGWQLYFGARFSAVAEYAFDEWFPVKIRVSGSQAEVYIGDMENPALFIPELKRKERSGAIGLTASSFSPAWFSDLSVDRTPVTLVHAGSAPAEILPPDMVASWQVSNAFDESEIESLEELSPDFHHSLTWSRLQSEPPGFANIARLRVLGETANTVFARLVIESSVKQAVLMNFGYSDSARVFLNDHLVYTGDNSYQSRDFRYLGTIGLFDGLNLQLQEGENELWIAVTESFGGWGVMARFGDANSITID